MDVNEIMDCLPHRYPFLLVDRVLELEEGKRIVGIKNTTINEPYFQGHFPGHPVMPGVLMIEALAQISGILLMASIPNSKGKLAYFAAIQDVRFKRPVLPGDQLRLEVDLKKIKRSVGKTLGKVFVEGKVVAQAEITLAIQDAHVEKRIDPTAKIHPNAEIGKDVTIGPHAYIGEGVKIGNGVIIEANVVLEKWVTIGNDCHIHYGTIIGNTTQDKKYKGEKSYVEIGDRNDIREYVTINRATEKGGKTKIGNDNLLLTSVHIAHDCVIGNNVVISNAAQLAGHLQIGNNVIIGGMTGILQFTRIGDFAMVGGYSSVRQDIPPHMLVEGNPAVIRSLNIIGMDRQNYSVEQKKAMKDAYKSFYRAKLNTTQAIERIKKEVKQTQQVEDFVKFVMADSKNGIMRRGTASKTTENDPT